MDVDDLLPLSGLQHVIFCERQCALIHVEGLWIENPLTASGRVEHDRVHEASGEVRPDLRIYRALHIGSELLGITGVTDVVEFHLEAGKNVWRPYPVEHKHGLKGHRLADQVQLCAQALALEEMMAVEVPEGAIYYRTSNRRLTVKFSRQLREMTQVAARRFHEIVDQKITPRASYSKKCDHCSLKEACLPELTGDLEHYHGLVRELMNSDGKDGGA